MDTLFSHPWTLIAVVGLPVLGIVLKLLGFSLDRIARWYMYVAVFAVIVVMDSIFFPFIGGKDWFFRFAVELGLIAFTLWWAFEAKDGEAEALVKSTFKNPIVIAVSAFALAYLLAAIFANDAMAAFWSNYERGEGAFQLLHYYAFFLLLVTLFRKEEDWRNMFKASLAAAGLMIIYGIFGNYGASSFIGPYAGNTPPTGFWQTLFVGRFQGSLGNPAYVDPYLIFSMFFAAYLWVVHSGKSISTALRNWGYGILIAIFFLFFILGQTRGAFIGLGAGIFIFLVYLAFSKNIPLRKWSAIVLGILIVLGAVGFAIRNIPAVENIPEGRLLQLSFSDSTAQTRFWVWGEAWKGFLERPILGWGPENFTAVYDKFFNANFYVPGQNTETWFDRAHSVFFDYLSETGIIGLLAYLSMFVMFYVGFFKLRKRANDRDNTNAGHIIERALVFSVPVAYLVQGMAIFDVLPMYIPLFLFLAFAAWYESNHRPIANNQ